ncbi:MAG: ATP synthase F1 subunit gamma [Zetaproteobacteria bacterium]|nr:MAG: ATP synthase F1 subunit gamma [Zetaproteobacteria bacterium]
MPTLRDIKRRIASVKSTQQITRAMKLVAAAKLRRAQERIVEARPYCRTLGEMVSDLALRSPREMHPLLRESAMAAEDGPTRKLLLVITGDRGLCGAFNSAILRRSLELLRAEQDDPDVSLALIVIGRKARDFYRRRGQVSVRSEYANFFDKLAFSHAAQIGQEVAAAFAADEVDRVQLVYNEFRSAASQRVAVETLLPIQSGAGSEETAGVEYLFEPSPQAILADLLPRHIETQVYRALMESLAAEYGARMTAMDNATKNAAEMIDLLTIQFNKARQERITKELLEIVSGAEALRHGAN